MGGFCSRCATRIEQENDEDERIDYFHKKSKQYGFQKEKARQYPVVDLSVIIQKDHPSEERGLNFTELMYVDYVLGRDTYLNASVLTERIKGEKNTGNIMTDLVKPGFNKDQENRKDLLANLILRKNRIYVV